MRHVRTILQIILNKRAPGHGEIRIPFLEAAVAVQLFGNASDTDPLKQEDFLAPEFVWFVSPGCSVRAQLARALRRDSGDQATLSVSWQF